ncbi:alpha/beta hydrolase [Streptomyces avicenniae]|uniref:alpha/beta hydrolase n=1 Tax=Streptomyces avicenniae TaxID=500153 RepID=UPI00069A06F6|nr:alpha/beta hydrolase [Streptomyces avicenniae]
MITVEELDAVRPEIIRTRASHWGRVSRAARSAWEVVDHRMAATVRTQTGDTAAAAELSLTRLAENFEYARVQCGLVEVALYTLADELQGVRTRLSALCDEAAEYGLTVHASGRVTYPASPYGEGADPVPGGSVSPEPGAEWMPPLEQHTELSLPLVNPLRQVAQRLANGIGGVLLNAESIDSEYAAALGELATEAGLSVTDAMWADAQDDQGTVLDASVGALDDDAVPTGLTPEENRAWWAGLPQSERDTLLALHPAAIGALDGLPATVRDTANRTVLDMEHGTATTDLAALRADEPADRDSAAWETWHQDRTALENRLQAMQPLYDRFEQTGVEGLPEAYLLGFSTEGDGRAILANGNPDTADHTAVFVPGTSADLDSVGDPVTRMTDLWRAADAQTGGQVSTITWLGYDAPDSVFPNAASEGYARDAAPDLTAFTSGLRTSHEGPEDSHTTLIGHSYGSTVIGAASQHDSLSVDDVVVAGSPGMLVNDASDLAVGSRHVWSLAAGVGDDPVPLIGAPFLGSDWIDMGMRPGPLGLPIFEIETGPQVPSMESFGANRVVTDSTGHGDYWRPDSESLRNQAWIVLGQYDQVGLE